VTVPPLDAVEPWERQPGESPKAFAAFAAYRDMPPHARSLVRVAELLGRQAGVTSASKRRRAGGQLYEWSRLHGWVSRAEAWDRHKDQEVRAAQVEAAREANRLHATMLRAEFNILVRRLSTIDPKELGAGEAIRLSKEIIMTERLILGQPIAIERVEHRVAGGSGPTPNGALPPHPNYNPSPAEIAEVLAMMGQLGMFAESDDVPKKPESEVSE